MLDYLFVVAMGAMVWFGAREIVDGRLSEGELAMFLLYMALLHQPVSTAGWMVNQLAATHAAGKTHFRGARRRVAGPGGLQRSVGRGGPWARSVR